MKKKKIYVFLPAICVGRLLKYIVDVRPYLEGVYLLVD